ncbi:MAG: hypothetical protein KKB51_03670 [Candidatus Riflebacteria bacterium]|nr:hypothetical protein [Candidatus Riflebacteria bacterium]
MLDHPSFPVKGERVLLFLAKNNEGTWYLKSGVQCLCPLESGTDKTLGVDYNLR